MLTGIYAVSFRANNQNFGNGVAVFTADNKVGGGDDNYYYKGSLNVNGTTASGDIQVAHYQGAHNSIIGADNYALRVSGSVAGSTIILNGEVVGRPGISITIESKKIADL